MHLGEVQTPSLVEAVLPVAGALALPALVRGMQGGFPCQGGCRRAAELVHVWRSEGESSGSEASLVQPERQLVFPEPVQHPRGKPDSERQPKNSCPGHVHSPERRGSEKGLQLPKEQPPAQPQSCSAVCKERHPHPPERHPHPSEKHLHPSEGPLRPSEGQRLCSFTINCCSLPRSPLPTAKPLAAVFPSVTLSTVGWRVLGPFPSTAAAVPALPVTAAGLRPSSLG